MKPYSDYHTIYILKQMTFIWNFYLICNVTKHKFSLHKLGDVDEDGDHNGGEDESDGV